jgi:hypothetical protein
MNAANFDVKPYPADIVRKITDRMVEFFTPANQDGFGTGLFVKSDRPVLGVAALSLPSEETTLSVLRVRLPADQGALGAAIIRIEESCLRQIKGC